MMQQRLSSLNESLDNAASGGHNASAHNRSTYGPAAAYAHYNGPPQAVHARNISGHGLPPHQASPATNVHNSSGYPPTGNHTYLQQQQQQQQQHPPMPHQFYSSQSAASPPPPAPHGATPAPQEHPMAGASGSNGASSSLPVAASHHQTPNTSSYMNAAYPHQQQQHHEQYQRPQQQQQQQHTSGTTASANGNTYEYGAHDVRTSNADFLRRAESPQAAAPASFASSSASPLIGRANSSGAGAAGVSTVVSRMTSVSMARDEHQYTYGDHRPATHSYSSSAAAIGEVEVVGRQQPEIRGGHASRSGGGPEQQSQRRIDASYSDTPDAYDEVAESPSYSLFQGGPRRQSSPPLNGTNDAYFHGHQYQQQSQSLGPQRSVPQQSTADPNGGGSNDSAVIAALLRQQEEMQRAMAAQSAAIAALTTTIAAGANNGGKAAHTAAMDAAANFSASPSPDNARREGAGYGQQQQQQHSAESTAAVATAGSAAASSVGASASAAAAPMPLKERSMTLAEMQQSLRDRLRAKEAAAEAMLEAERQLREAEGGNADDDEMAGEDEGAYFGGDYQQQERQGHRASASVSSATRGASATSIEGGGGANGTDRSRSRSRSRGPQQQQQQQQREQQQQQPAGGGNKRSFPTSSFAPPTASARRSTSPGASSRDPSHGTLQQPTISNTAAEGGRRVRAMVNGGVGGDAGSTQHRAQQHQQSFAASSASAASHEEAQQPSSAPPIRHENVVVTAMSGAEVFAVLRLRGLVTSSGDTGERLLPPARCHTMALTADERSQLMELRDSLAALQMSSSAASQHSQQQQNTANAGGGIPSSAIPRRSRSPSAGANDRDRAGGDVSSSTLSRWRM